MSALRAISIALLVTALAACNRSDPPSDRLEKAAESVVESSVKSPAAKSVGRFAPRDDCGAVAGAGEFRGKLRAAVAARDTDALLELTAEDVKLDFGGGAGHDQLRQRLAAKDGELWQEIETVLTLGCASDGEARLTLPWYFAQEIRQDPYASYIVTGQDVALLSAPGSDAPELKRISWDVVERVDEGPVYPGFVHVRWADANATSTEPLEIDGYIAEDHLRSLLDFRVLAASRNGRWRIVSMVAGD